MKKIYFFLKLFVSGCIALAVLTAFSMVYYNPPLATVQPDKTTNYKSVENRMWSCMTEGFGYGTTDNLGYNNYYDKNCTDPDILFIGSSHLEATQVSEDSNMVAVLSKLLAEDDTEANDYKCLNLGVSGHSFDVSVSNLDNIVETYSGFKYLFIETSSVKFSPEVIDGMLEGKYHSDYQEGGKLRSLLRNSPYVRLMAKKVTDLQDGKAQSKPASNDKDMDLYSRKMGEVLKKISALSEKHGFEPVILFHNRTETDASGNVEYTHDMEYLEAFKKGCEENGITFLDVTPRFIEELKTTYTPAYGFANTLPGKGHLNKDGHRFTAEEIYKIIK